MLVTQREASRMGRERGNNAARWIFDGNTTDATYRAFLKGFEGGDPAILDQYSQSWLSGESGESIPEILGDAETQRELDRMEGVEAAYESAADWAYWAELERIARFHVREGF